MKKVIVGLIVLVIGFYFYQVSDNVLIPKDAIRFRVIANSNSESDQEIKKIVSNTLQKELYSSLIDVKSVDEAREVLKNSTSILEENIQKTLLENNTKEVFNINYGMNYFPEKIYNGVEYKAGEYESLVVTLGSGIGDNWWCVLFPPLCLMEAEEVRDSDEVQYRFFIKEIIDKYF